MPIARRVAPALAAAFISLLSLSSSASAAAPASVSVRVEGANATLLAPTQVTTTTSPVEKDGNPAHSCTGTSAAGALDLATSGSWGGAWFSGLGYSVETLLGEAHKFEAGAAANYFWSFWLDNKPSAIGICETELNAGDSLLFFPDCFSETGGCPPAPNPLAISTPAVAEPGPLTVTVTSYANASGAPSPAAGATVTGDGVSATTDAGGQATLALSSTGNVVIQASAPDSVRTEFTVCLHRGSDGNCATAGPFGSSGASSSSSSPSATAVYKGPFAVVASAAGIADNHVYAFGRAPRVLAGSVTAHTSIASVSLRLRRSYRGRCFAYNGTSERFMRTKCGRGASFKVAGTSRFSYLLPSALPRGRYVLDIEASDSAGNRTSLARGTSRIVFYVR